MPRDSMRSLLRLLLSGLMLVACGGVPEETGLAPAEEQLGTQQAALCSGLSITALGINGISSWAGEMAGNGSWAVSGGANAIRLEYRVDGALRSSEERTGTSGTWYFSTQGITCGSHTFEARAVPMVIDSAGNRTTCWESPTSISQAVTQDCPTASISCSRSALTVDCTGTASGGTGGYTRFWREGDDTSANSWYQGTGTASFFCPMKTRENPYTGEVLIQFKVRDSSGMESAAASRSYLCAF